MIFQGDDDRAMWQRLETSGLMEEQLIGQVCPQFAVQKDALLKLMEKFDLICERLPRKHVRSLLSSLGAPTIIESNFHTF